ncbi:translin family protein [Candidatus Nitrosotenuis sp. DW1]|uniref:translin family protein n=1 Tax=Candidatus Nitrosotenuis sp. DW1 TaxID=2259672 RepID=UPI0015C82B15|nr:RNA-binding protein [Candidatus Nitrosotenuis sp. DW1]QLH08377.1 RNA-binding protein [Candidatus Nitrosotenuis sp. DW1]
MSLKDAKASLSKISKSLEKTQDSREDLIKNTRQIITLCSESIISIHRNDTKNAAVKIQSAKRLLEKFRKEIDQSLYRYLIPSEQEFVEASSFLAIIQHKPVPTFESLKVKEESYVLGLLDCVGELRRNIYDRIRTGNLEEAKKTFDLMEDLYLELYPFASFDKVVKEARRKLDVDRILVEETRTALTEEIRRQELIDTIKKIKK